MKLPPECTIRFWRVHNIWVVPVLCRDYRFPDKYFKRFFASGVRNKYHEIVTIVHVVCEPSRPTSRRITRSMSAVHQRGRRAGKNLESNGMEQTMKTRRELCTRFPRRAIHRRWYTSTTPIPPPTSLDVPLTHTTHSRSPSDTA